MKLMTFVSLCVDIRLPVRSMKVIPQSSSRNVTSTPVSCLFVAAATFEANCPYPFLLVCANSIRKTIIPLERCAGVFAPLLVNTTILQLSRFCLLCSLRKVASACVPVSYSLPNIALQSGSRSKLKIVSYSCQV